MLTLRRKGRRGGGGSTPSWFFKQFYQEDFLIAVGDIKKRSSEVWCEIPNVLKCNVEKSVEKCSFLIKL